MSSPASGPAPSILPLDTSSESSHRYSIPPGTFTKQVVTRSPEFSPTSVRHPVATSIPDFTISVSAVTGVPVALPSHSSSKHNVSTIAASSSISLAFVAVVIFLCWTRCLRIRAKVATWCRSRTQDNSDDQIPRPHSGIGVNLEAGETGSVTISSNVRTSWSGSTPEEQPSDTSRNPSLHKSEETYYATNRHMSSSQHSLEDETTGQESDPFIEGQMESLVEKSRGANEETVSPSLELPVNTAQIRQSYFQGNNSDDHVGTTMGTDTAPVSHVVQEYDSITHTPPTSRPLGSTRRVDVHEIIRAEIVDLQARAARLENALSASVSAQSDTLDATDIFEPPPVYNERG